MKWVLSRRFLLGLSALALSPAAIWAQTVPLVGDTFVIPGNPTNYGSTVNVNVGGSLSEQGLLQFDLSELPPGTTAASVTAASLRLFVNKIGAPGAINISVPTASWSELTVNGASGPGVGALVAGPITVPAAGSFLSIPLTAQVQAWLNGATNNGLIITADPSSTSIFIDSKENTTTSHPAVLEIDLVGQTGATGPSGPSGPTGATGATGTVGLTGASGLAGAQGATGVAGPAGATGPVGAAGPAGATGVTGAMGATGATGAAGVTGSPGNTGAAGATGAIGSFGPSGATGLTGNPGSGGAAGPAGPTGPQGVINNSLTLETYCLSPTCPNDGNGYPAFTISSSDTHNTIMVDNPESPGNTDITLPLSSAAGAGYMISINVLRWGADDGGLTVYTAGSDTFPQLASGSNTSQEFNYQGQLITDGAGHWYMVINN
jgi:hypothetical protein